MGVHARTCVLVNFRQERKSGRKPPLSVYPGVGGFWYPLVESGRISEKGGLPMQVCYLGAGGTLMFAGHGLTLQESHTGMLLSHGHKLP